VRQLITNQEPIFNEAFFATVQLLIAGNDAQGARYGTVTTPEPFFVDWKLQEQTGGMSTGFHRSAHVMADVVGAGYAEYLVAGALLDAPLAQLCDKARLLDLIRNFVIFDGGIKKIPRPHQYTGVKRAQERMAKREGGVIWHTQGSGKSILMVLLAKWLLEHDPDGRILIVTDRDELDRQILDVMRNAGLISEHAPSARITSRDQFLEHLAAPMPRLLCALVHKFDPSDLKGPPPRITGRFYIFVDECHRTQGGKMNRQMKRWLESAIFVGFTGTPLLRKDKQTTREVFGTYIHTYKFPEAVRDKVVLDLKYEARDVPERITEQASIDAWFAAKTMHLNNYQKAVLRKEWANMEKLMSAAERKQRIIASIIQDFGLRPRLSSDRGTALLVAASIYDACHYYRLFQNTPNFGRYCGIVTSYEPRGAAISKEPPDSDERFKYDTYTNHVLAPGQTTEAYEQEIKRQFVMEPARCKLLIVVSKLLTGFDAPSCTYVYLDNELHDHNLFQAICRTNRLDGQDKDYGYIVDFKELFGDVQQAIAVYSSDELDLDDGGEDENNVHMKDRLKEGKAQLDATREALHYLCEPVQAPKELEQYLQYFCGNAADPDALSNTEPLRVEFYKAVANFLRAFAAIALDLTDAGYTDKEATDLRREVDFFADIRSAIKKVSGEELDTKPYEADMRHLLNTYVQADPADPQGTLDNFSLLELIVETGIHDAIANKLNERGKLSRNAIAEGIINNVRRTIIRDQLTDPMFYQQMSKLLDDLVAQSRDSAEKYEEFLKKAEVMARQMASKGKASAHPSSLDGHPEAIVLFNNLPGIQGVTWECPADPEDRATLALTLDQAMQQHAPAAWKGDQARESRVKNALYPLMDKDKAATLALFDIIKNIPGYA
jgi:type I restriction enzyme, R subunit